MSGPVRVLVDSSVWIDFFSASPGPAGQLLRQWIADAQPVLIAGVVITEILQGLTRDVETIERFLSQWEMLEPQGIATYIRAANLFRLGRSRGLPLTTVDVLIAGIALDHKVELFTLDRDFARLARFVPLSIHRLNS